MARKLGQDVTITAGGKTVGRANSCDYDEPTEMVDTSAMDDSWDVPSPGSQSATMTIEYLWIPDGDAYSAIRNAKSGGTTLTLKWTDADGYGRSGDAYVSNMPFSWARNDPLSGTYEFTFSGSVTDDPDYSS